MLEPCGATWQLTSKNPTCMIHMIHLDDISRLSCIWSYAPHMFQTYACKLLLNGLESQSILCMFSSKNLLVKVK